MIFKIYEPLNNKKAIAFTKSLPTKVALGIRLGLNESGKLLQKYTREQMIRGAKSGRVYKTYIGINGRKLASPRIHRASAAGEFPARITGALSRSIGFTVFGSARLEFGARAKYAKFLEEGTSKIAPRKYLLQTVKKLDKEVQVTLVKRINAEMRKGGAKI
jgi:HK97 gp10 family phage protein